MTDWRPNDEYPQDPYAQPPQGPPPSAQDPYGQPQYGQPQYGPPQYGAQQYGQPAYGQQPPPYAQQPPQYGYGAPGYGAPGYGYPAPYGAGPVDPADRRPGTLLTAAILGYVTGGLLIIAAFYCFIGASALESVSEDFGGDDGSYTTQFVFAGLVNLVAAGLLIAGSVTMTGRKPNGRVMYAVGCGLVIAACVYWLAQWASKDGLGGITVFAVLYGGLVVVGAAMAFTSAGNRWMSRAR